ncbi:MAG: IPT/TIG domain-containing protein, partial [Bacteroidia bacterium]|nr:IPT/TIG domain-containing protein [Bacteroidia bacterium]
MKTSILIIPALALTTIVSAQCLMREVPLSERVHSATAIVEGKVVCKQSFWNSGHNYIYTSNIVEVYKVFKGNIATSNIEIITEGGVVDGKAIIANPSLKLSTGQTGIFFVNTDVSLRSNSFKPYSGPQGFIQYDFSQNKAVDAFSVYAGITTNLYQKIKSLTGRGFTTIQTFDVNENLQESGRATPVISNFSPTTLSAGTRTLLTINGSNFGSTRGSGSVSFCNADLGGVAYTGVSQPLYYQQWTDTQIKIYVPGDVMASSVGTGNIQVTNNSSETGTSSSPLTIDFNRYEVIYAGEIIPTILYDDNGSGGYTFIPHTEVAALPAATSAINRALSTWNCSDQINWNISSSSTTTDVTTGDGVNVIRFDNGTEMSSGTLGYGSSYWGLYSNGVQKYWVLTETDITMDDGTNWNYGPGNPASSQYDFESVLLHELGHIHQFNHSGNISSPMYYGIANG